MKIKFKFIYFLILGLIISIIAVENYPDFYLSKFLKNNNQDFLIIGHRGAAKYAPENTLASFQKAIDLQVDGIEADVIFTKDDVPIIAHHYNMNNLVPSYQHPALINKMTLTEVKKLDVGSWFAEKYKNERILTLQESLIFLKGKLKRIYLHDKKENTYFGNREKRIANFASIIRNSGMQNKIIVMVESGNIKLWQKIAPDITLLQCWNGPAYDKSHIPLNKSYTAGIKNMGVLTSKNYLSKTGKILYNLGFKNISFFINTWPKKEIINYYHNRGVDFTVFTINNKFLMKLYLNLGFNAIGTDDPALLYSLVNNNN